MTVKFLHKMKFFFAFVKKIIYNYGILTLSNLNKKRHFALTSMLSVRSRGWVAVNKKQVNPDPGLTGMQTSGRTNVKEAKQQSFKMFYL